MKKSLKSKFRFKMLKNGPNMTKSIQIKQIKSFLTKFQSPKLLRRCPNKSNKCLKWSKSNSCLAQILIQCGSKSWISNVDQKVDTLRTASYSRWQMNSKMYSVFTCSINDMINTVQIWELITLSYNLCHHPFCSF